MGKFVHLHVYSDYTANHGLVSIEELTEKAAEFQMEALAITDRNILSGTAMFYRECRRNEIKPIIGWEIMIKNTQGENYPLVLLVKNQEGYKSFCKLSAFANGVFPTEELWFSTDALKSCHEGLIALSGGAKGEISHLIKKEELTRARTIAQQYQDLFGNDFFIEIQRCGEFNEKKINANLAKLAKDLQLKLVATDVSNAKETILRSEKEMAFLFQDYPEAISNTVIIADKCTFSFHASPFSFPKYPIPKEGCAEAYLRKLCTEGLKKRYTEITQKIRQRMDAEIGMILKNRLFDQYLIVWDMVHFAKKKGIMIGWGIGSASGSLVNYALGITDIDPLKYNLVFERFIDSDLFLRPQIVIQCSDKGKGCVLQYLSKRYGKEKICLTHISKKSPWVSSLSPCLFNIDGIILLPNPVSQKLPVFHREYFGEIYQESQYDKRTIEELGAFFLEISTNTFFLNIQKTLLLIKTATGIDIDLAKIPLDDSKTYSILWQIGIKYMSQIGDFDTTDLFRDINPKNFYDIMAIFVFRPSCLMNSGIFNEFICRKKGEKAIVYDHPILEPILKESYGLILYQEQIMLIAEKIAGLSMIEANRIRKAMGKKQWDLVNKYYKIFIEGAIQNGITESVAIKIFEQMNYAAEFVCNKSHAATHGIIMYQIAYLKANYPKAFQESFEGYY